jgi:serine/threonine-protein kinase
LFAANALRVSRLKSEGAVQVTQEPSTLPAAAPPVAVSSAPPSTSVAEEPPAAAMIAPQPSSLQPHVAPAAKPASREGTSRHATAKPTVGGEPPAAAAKSLCDPPWTLDAQGIKQYKLQCL